MSRLVDERVVEMSFDNRDFEKHTKESMQTIDELKESMDFSGVADSINDSFDSVDTSVLAKGLNKISDSFSTLEIVAISAISNITNRLMNLGTNLVKSLSIDNITSGWQKYADTTISVGTLISQGFDMDTVTEQLEKLQFFTDETSYTFTDMVSNIGKFTAAGQDLETSVEAMMGIANWAALSGQNATTASRAMYQLSQAMGAGVVRLQDYRSIQSANMDTVEFRQTVLDTAKDIGTLTESIDGMYQTANGKSFNVDQFTEYLSEGWFTSDVLVKALNKYSSAVDDIYKYTLENDVTASEAIEALNDNLDAFGMKAFKASQEARTFEDVINSVKEAAGSGFSNIFQSIFGAYDKAKVLWTDLANELYDLFIEPINLVSSAFQTWSEEGRDLLFANTEESTGAFWDIYYAISGIANIFRESFLKVFDIDTADKLADKLLEITQSIKAFTSQLEITEEFSETLSDIFGGLASTLKALFSTFTSLIKGMKPIFKFVITTVRKVLDILADIGKRITDFVSTTTIFKDIQEFLSSFLSDILDFIDSLKIIDGLRERIARFFDLFKESGGTFENIKRIVNDIFTVVNFIKNAALTLVDVFMKYVYPVLKPIIDIALDIIPVVLGTIIKWVAELSDFLLGLFGVIKSGGNFNDIINYIVTGFGKFGAMFSNFFSKIGSIFTEERLTKFVEFASVLLDKLADLFISIGDIILGLFDFAKTALPIVSDFLSFLTAQLTKIGVSLKGLFNGNGFGADLIKVLLGLAAFIAIVTAIKWKTDSVKSIIAPIGYILESVADLADSVAQMNYTTAMKNLATAILMIVAGIMILASIDKGKLILASVIMVTIMGLMFGLLVYMKNMVSEIKTFGEFKEVTRSIRNIYKIALAMILIAGAMLLATAPILLLSKQPIGNVLTSILAYAAIVGAMVLFTKVLSKSINAKDALKFSLVITAISSSLLLATLPLLLLSKLEWPQLMNGIKGMIATMSMIVLSAVIFTLLGKVLKEIAIGAAAVAALSVTLLLTALAFKSIGLALVECVKPYKELGKMTWGGIAKATVGLFSILLLVSMLSMVAPLVSIGILTALGLYTFGVSLTKFIEPMKEIVAIPWDRVSKAFTSMLGSILVLSLIGTFLGLLGGLGLSAIAGSLSLLGTALIILASGLVPFIAAIAEMQKLDFGQILGFVLKIIVVAAGIAMAVKILTPTLLFLSVLSLLLLPLILVITKFVSSMAILVLGFTALLTLLSTLSGENIQNGVVSVVQGLHESFPLILDMLHQLLGEVLYFVKEAVRLVFQLFFLSITENIEGVASIIATIFSAIADAARAVMPKLIKALLEGFYLALTEEVPKLLDGLLKLVINLFDTLTEDVPKMLNSIKNFIEEILYQAAKILVTALPDFFRIIFKGFKDGLLEEWNKTRESSTGIFRKFLDWVSDELGINSPSTKMREIGQYVSEGFTLGIFDRQKLVHDTAEGLGDQVEEGLADSKISNAIYSFINLLNGELDDNQIVITPVLDLTEIQNGKDSLFSMLGSGGSVMADTVGYADNLFSSLSTKKNNLVTELNKQGLVGSQPQETVINNTFNVTGDDPEEIAYAISNILQSQVDRRKAEWAT